LIPAKKSLGQHFLHEVSYAQRIAEAISPDIRYAVEVGPGHGMLTRFLIGRFDHLLLIEKDAVLARTAHEKWASDHISVREADFLTFDLRAYWGERSFAVIGNFPYNISSQIVFRVLELRDQIPEMVGMFQYEMARRILSGPGSKDYGILSVLTATSYYGRMLFKVPPGAFSPPPKVESAAIRLERKADYTMPCDFNSLRRVVRCAFGQRRKMLRNSLKPLFSEKTLLDDVLFQKRPEQVSVPEFIDLAIRYESGRESLP
jgi:16S rRNA (adenine1518-N6/adenine1519-N6)-dimethyltransferase